MNKEVSWNVLWVILVLNNDMSLIDCKIEIVGTNVQN